MSDEYIPRATAEKIGEPAPVGSRHKIAMDIALPLIGNGMPESVVFQTLRAKFEPDVTDDEINGVIRWAKNKNPSPSVPTHRANGHYVPAPSIAIKRTPIDQAEWWTGGARLDPDTMLAQSTIRIVEENAASLAIGSLYSSADNLNIVCKYLLDGDKAKPVGGGKTLPRDEWVSIFQTDAVPQSLAGAWFRPNPCGAKGSGADGAITDSDVTAFKFLLVESDVLPLPVQLAFYRRLPLPIAAVVLSGGHSAHAWVRLDSPDGETHKTRCTRILKLLEPFGIDQLNKNPSRLSRLPGATRTIGAENGGLQRLIWLNPNAVPVTDETITRLDECLRFPAIDEKPLKALAQSSVARYEEMTRNVGKLGVPTGIPAFDVVSGGLKSGHTIVIAGETGGGKTTLGVHMIHAALKDGYGVALFSLEMDREEIFDLLVSNRASINRNKFNTGAFTNYDLELMSKELPPISKLPLYIEDSPMTGTDQIRMRAFQLKDLIGLVVVDYIQFVNPALGKDTREQQIARISHELRALAREIRKPMIVLSQLNEDGKLRESRVIAHNANIVMIVEVVEDRFVIKIVKGRHIPLGEYKMNWNPSFGRLTPLQTEETNNPHNS